MAKRFVSSHIETQSVYLNSDDDVAFIAEIGSEVEKGGILLTYSNALYDVETHRHLRSEGGEVVNIEIYSNIPDKDVPENLKPLFNKYKDYFIKVNGKYPTGKFTNRKNNPTINILKGKTEFKYSSV